MKNVLLHICCGPCAIMPLEKLEEESFEVSGFFYNPNIQPAQEFLARYRALKRFAEISGLQLIGEVKYEPEVHLRAVSSKPDERCLICYSIRIKRAAEIAKEHGFDAFTSTLLVSPHQKFEAITEMGRSYGEEFGIEFLERDFRPFYYEGVKKSKDMELYRQKYCGCIYSEKERYGRDLARELG